MALNPNTLGKTDSECTGAGYQHQEGGEPQKNPAATSATANQNGDQPGCGDGVMPEQEAPERRKSVQVDARSCSSSPSPAQKTNEELPRRNFQIPRKTRERKGLYKFLPPDSREFEELVKIISSFYLDASSRGTFSYCKARLIHNELLEKEFIEKRREMKQEGRTELDLAESYCFLYPDKSKLQWICEKGLSVGHCRITTLGNPSVGVYLSKYSDLLQINPFEAGSSGDMIIFKVMRGRTMAILENMPKNAIEPSPKFDCHFSKSAGRVTSLLSYRAFELTQQYFYEFAFDEIKARPRHVCPYAVVSFQFKGKEASASPMVTHRFNTVSPEQSRGKSCYTVWSGPLVNKNQELFPICLKSSSRPYLPFRLPEKLEMSRGMQLEQVKRKIPSLLFSWDTYSASREVMKCGMSCSLFEVVDGKGKATCGSLTALMNKLERDRMVLVKSLYDRGYLFLLSSAQMVESKERRGRIEKKLQALFIFQDSRTVVKYFSRLFEAEPLSVESPPAMLSSMETFTPAVHYALFKLRPNPGKDLSCGVERQATEYISRMDSGTVRPFILPDYKHTMDERTTPLPVPRPKFNIDAVLRSYVHNPANYVLPLCKAKDIIERIRNPAPIPTPTPAPAPVEYSPVSDWGGSDRGSDRADRPSDKPCQERPSLEKAGPDVSKRRPGVANANGAQLQPKSQLEPQSQKLRLSQSEYDKDKMKQLLKLIQLHKKALVKDPERDQGEDGAWNPNSLKRKFEGDERGCANKYQRTDHLSNGEPSRVAHNDDMDEDGQNDNLTAVMESMGIYDTDLRACGNANASAVNETQRLLKILLATLNKAMAQGSLSAPGNLGEPSSGSGKLDSFLAHPIFGKQNETALPTNYTEEDMDCSPGSLASLGSPPEQMQSTNIPSGGVLTNEDKAPPFLEHAAENDAESQTSAETKKLSAAISTAVNEAAFRPSISLDTILNQEVYSLTSNIRKMMQNRHIGYASQLPPRLPLRSSWQPSNPFSDFVRRHVSPVPVQGHVDALLEKMDKLIPVSPAPCEVAPQLLPAASDPAESPSLPVQTAKAKTEPSLMKSSPTCRNGKTSGDAAAAATKAKSECSASTGEVYSPSQATPDSPEMNSQKSGRAAGRGSGLLAGSLIGQLKPEVFSSLVEIFKDVTKNTVKFYIYSGDEEESIVCKEIKGYLKSLGNSECSPQTFLENSGSLDKLLIIIKNEDIAAHVHKIPALVSLKKLPSVSFAGVDTLDDVKNHTYNELFVSGGFIVSDEFVLNPDLITQDRLQGLLKFLEEQSSPEHPWQWKVHCKSQKKLKELGRLNTNAVGLLNLLAAYQKKHLVEFLPYHECDTQTRQAPELDCLIKLQAQHTQQRHLIFLTERPFEMFLQYSRNGIVIASIDDVMSGFHSLIGSINQSELPTPPPSTVMNDECVDEEDMSLDSDDGDQPAASDGSQHLGDAPNKKPPLPPPPESEEFRPPLPDRQVTADGSLSLSDGSALKTAISQFKASNQMGMGSSDMGSLSPGGFPVNPHQSFLCPSGSWSSYTGSSSYAASPAYPASPCSGTQEQEYRPATTTSSTAPPVNALAGSLSKLGTLPLEVKPPPPPHLMMLGQTYVSDTGAAGNSPLPSKLHSDSTQSGFLPGPGCGLTPEQDRTLGGAGENSWGSGACITTNSQGGVTSGTGDPTGLPKTGEMLLGSTPGRPAGRTHVNCSDNPGVAVGLPVGATRGGSALRPKLPPHPMVGVGYGGIRGQMEHGPIRGAMGPGYRGRGVPPGGPWPRHGRGNELRDGRGGGPCSWGYPGSRGGPQKYYTNYSYSHSYAPE